MYTISKPLSLSAYDHPDIYPGPSPKSPFLYMNGTTYFLQGNKHLDNLSVVLDSKRVKLNKLLINLGVASLEERYPVLSYGSNACLAQLKYKYQMNPKLCNLIIHLKGFIFDADVIYSSTLTRYSAIPATLAPMKGARCQIWLSLLDDMQLQHMIQTEKPYTLALYSGNKLYLDQGIKPKSCYAFLYNQALTLGGTYFRYPDIPATGSRASHVWQAHMLEFISSFYKMDREHFIKKVKIDDRFRGKVQAALQRISKHVVWDEWEKVDKVQQWGNMQE